MRRGQHFPGRSISDMRRVNMESSGQNRSSIEGKISVMISAYEKVKRVSNDVETWDMIAEAFLGRLPTKRRVSLKTEIGSEASYV